jgi:hypothetical protein
MSFRSVAGGSAEYPPTMICGRHMRHQPKAAAPYCVTERMDGLPNHEVRIRLRTGWETSILHITGPIQP